MEFNVGECQEPEKPQARWRERLKDNLMMMVVGRKVDKGLKQFQYSGASTDAGKWENLCNRAAGEVIAAAGDLNLTARTFWVSDLNRERGVTGGLTHLVTIVEGKTGKYLFDRTFDQFLREPGTVAQVGTLDKWPVPGDSKLIGTLLNQGWARISDETLGEYLDWTLPPEKRRGAASLTMLETVEPYNSTR